MKRFPGMVKSQDHNMARKLPVLGDHVRKYTIEQSVSIMDNCEHKKIRSFTYMYNRNSNSRRETHHIKL